MLKKLNAFTLAEVLIVMAVIGIVSGLTVPKLKENFDARTRVAQTRKVAIDLQTAFDSATSRYGVPQGWLGTDSSNYTKNFASKYFEALSLSITCNANTSCMPKWSSLDTNTSYYKAILKSGAAIALRITNNSRTCNGTAFSNVYYHCPMGEIFVDVNGNDGPNQAGLDYFRFVVSQSGIEPEGLSETNGVVLGSNGANNAAWVIKAGNQDYLDCPSTLNWKGKIYSCH